PGGPAALRARRPLRLPLRGRRDAPRHGSMVAPRGERPLRPGAHARRRPAHGGPRGRRAAALSQGINSRPRHAMHAISALLLDWPGPRLLAARGIREPSSPQGRRAVRAHDEPPSAQKEIPMRVILVPFRAVLGLLLAASLVVPGAARATKTFDIDQDGTPDLIVDQGLLRQHWIVRMETFD